MVKPPLPNSLSSPSSALSFVGMSSPSLSSPSLSFPSMMTSMSSPLMMTSPPMSFAGHKAILSAPKVRSVQQKGTSSDPSKLDIPSYPCSLVMPSHILSKFACTHLLFSVSQTPGIVKSGRKHPSYIQLSGQPLLELSLGPLVSQSTQNSFSPISSRSRGNVPASIASSCFLISSA